MKLFDNADRFREIEKRIPIAMEKLEDPLIMGPYTDDFARRFCWNSNAIEGNTLSLEETVAVIDYDEVDGGHPFSEYQEAKALYGAIKSQMLPLQERRIDEPWIKRANALLMMSDGEYRKGAVYIGTVLEAVFYPPDYREVPKLVKRYVDGLAHGGDSPGGILEKIAEDHLKFERIHPFQDGNGRTGRMILNQQLINHGFLPVILEPMRDYRQAFRRYDKNGDVSQMVYLLCKGELGSIAQVEQFCRKREGRRMQDVPGRDAGGGRKR